MARVHGVYLRKPPKGPSAYNSKEAALAANPTMIVPDAAFPKHKLDSVKNAAFRVNSGSRGDWAPGIFFAIWDYAPDVILRISKADPKGSAQEKDGGSVEVLGFIENGEVIGASGESVGSAEAVLKEEDVEAGGWILGIGAHPNVPEGWEEIVSAPGSRRKKKS